MKALSELSGKDKQKLAIAGGLFAVAAIVLIVTMMRGGAGGGVPRDAQAAQDKVLQQIQGEEPPPADTETGATPPASDQPAGRPRSARPGK